jgi:flagellin-specific chaperone FliS
MTGKILQADIDKDLDAIDQVIRMLNELLSAWKELLTKPDNRIQPDAVRFYDNQMPKEQGYIRV